MLTNMYVNSMPWREEQGKC